jgi:tRNA 2-thiouridine synthesizing protein C
MANTIAVLMRKAPYGSVYTAEGFRSMMGVGVFEMDISVLFADDGVYALLKSQNPAALGMKPLGDGFPSLSDFGVTRFYVHAPSLAERGLAPADLVMDVELVDDAGAAGVLAAAGLVLPF